MTKRDESLFEPREFHPYLIDDDSANGTSPADANRKVNAFFSDFHPT